MDIKEYDDHDLDKVLSDLAEYVHNDFRCDLGSTSPHLPQVEYMRKFLDSGLAYFGFSNEKAVAMGLLIPCYEDEVIKHVQFYWLFGNPNDFVEFVTKTIQAVREKFAPEKPEIWGIFSREDFANLLYAEDLYSRVEDLKHPALFGRTDFSGFPIRFEG